MAVLPQGGYDVHFVEPLSELWICPICLLVAREPRITECGHQFCLECLGFFMRDDNRTCPECRQELKEEEIYPNSKAKREIFCLKIWCDKHEEGCRWTGELRERDEHNKVCGYVTELCSNNCGELVMRKDMDDHKQNACNRRIVVCSYCDTQLEYAEVGRHYQTCDNCLVDCPYQCGVQVARKKVELHISREGDCLNSSLLCDFASVGCQFIGIGEKLRDHLDKNTVNHFHLAMKSLGILAERLSVAEEKQKETDSKLAAADKKQRKTDSKLVAIEKKHQETDNNLADGKKKQKETDSKLAVAEKEWEQTKAQLAATRGDYAKLKESLDVELKSSKTYRAIMKGGLKNSLQSLTFVNAVLDGQTEVSLEVGDSFVYLWKIDGRKLSDSQKKETLGQLTKVVKSVSSNEFYTGNPGLCLQLELCVMLAGSKYFYRARVCRLIGQYDRRLRWSKYLVSFFLLGCFGIISSINGETDFELQRLAASRDHLFKLDLPFPFSAHYPPGDVLYIVFQLEQH